MPARSESPAPLLPSVNATAFIFTAAAALPGQPEQHRGWLSTLTACDLELRLADILVYDVADAELLLLL